MIDNEMIEQIEKRMREKLGNEFVDNLKSSATQRARFLTVLMLDRLIERQLPRQQNHDLMNSLLDFYGLSVSMDMVETLVNSDDDLASSIGVIGLTSIAESTKTLGILKNRIHAILDLDLDKMMMMATQ